MPADEAVPESNPRRDALPRFYLSYTLDYDANPTRVIVYDITEGPDVTHWASIDIEHAIDLGEVA